MIDIAALFTDICMSLGAGRSNDRLVSQFPVCFNRVLNELAVASDHAQWTVVTGTTGTLNFPDQYEYVLFNGIQYYLIRSGHAPSDPKLAITVYEDSAKQWKEGKADFVQNEDNIKSHDPTQDMIGWGAIPTDT